MDDVVMILIAVSFALFIIWAVTRKRNNSGIDYVKSTSDCDRAIKIIRSHMSFPVLGLDCEWEPEWGSRNEVQVISLATLEGYCVVLQISRFAIPRSLRSLLLDPGIFKVGVGIQIDEQHLAFSGLRLNSWVDIRHLEKTSHPDKSLKGMAQRFVGMNLDKQMQLRGNWDGHLTEDQIRYAAKDAEAGIRICQVLLKDQHGYYYDPFGELHKFAEHSYPLRKRFMSQQL